MTKKYMSLLILILFEKTGIIECARKEEKLKKRIQIEKIEENGCGKQYYGFTSCKELFNLKRDRIFNGQDSKTGEFPWSAYIKIISKNKTSAAICGGTLISLRFVLTASHCVKVSKQDLLVTLGTNVIHDFMPQIQVKVEEIIHHPNYSQINFQNDIALLKLETTLNETKLIGPICLPVKSVNISKNEYGIVYGWGATSVTQNSSIFLKKAVVKRVNSSDPLCAKAARPYNATLSSSQLCCVNFEGYPANGDSGGPFFQYIDGNCTIVGIISYSFSLKLATIYTKVAAYLDWINSVINK